MPRPTIYKKELALRICTLLAEGQSLVKICRGKGMPALATVYSWLIENSDFRHAYDVARLDQADTMAAQIQEVADEKPVTFTDEKGRTRIDPAWAHVQRNRIDALKWTASKLKPKKYGDAVQLEHTGPNGEAFGSFTMLEVARRLAFVLRAGAEHAQHQPLRLVSPERAAAGD